MKSFLETIGVRRRPKTIDPFADGKLRRANYKDVWNLVSKSEVNAKFAVAGYTDEDTYAFTGQSTVDLLKRTVGVRTTDVMLEIGAGVGRVGACLAPICREWIGTDASDNMVGHIRNRLAAQTNVRAIVTNGYDLEGIESASIDVVYCTVVFMHIEEFERYRYIKEGFRVLKPGGRMLVDNINLLSDPGWALFEKNSSTPPLSRLPHVGKGSTPQELRAYFDRVGFEGTQQLVEGLWLITYGRKPALTA